LKKFIGKIIEVQMQCVQLPNGHGMQMEVIYHFAPESFRLQGFCHSWLTPPYLLPYRQGPQGHFFQGAYSLSVSFCATPKTQG